MNIYPLFPCQLGQDVIKEDMTALHLAKDKCNYRPISDSPVQKFQKSFISENRFILNDFPKEKNIILDYFYFYKNNFLKLNDTEFKMTTSWFTKVKPDGFSDYHYHPNSAFTGVFYFDDGSDIEFSDTYSRDMLHRFNDFSEFNLLNCKYFCHKTFENLILFFPSHMNHKQAYNDRPKIRYSLAFNFFPVGNFGSADSYIENLNFK